MAHWLSLNVWPYAIHTGVGTIAGALVLGCIITPFKRFIKQFWRAVDSLDPESNTGVTKQLAQIEQRAIRGAAYPTPTQLRVK